MAPPVVTNFGSGVWLLAAALGAGGSGGASAALPVGFLPAGLGAVLLAAAGAGQRAGQRLAALVASAARHIVTRQCRGCGRAVGTVRRRKLG